MTESGLAKYKLTSLNSVMAPVKKLPLGTTTRPPPAALHARTALLIAAVQSVTPSPTATMLQMSKSTAGKTGAAIRARIVGCVTFQANPSASLSAASPSGERPRRVAAVAPSDKRRKVRRDRATFDIGLMYSSYHDLGWIPNLPTRDRQRSTRVQCGLEVLRQSLASVPGDRIGNNGPGLRFFARPGDRLH